MLKRTFKIIERKKYRPELQVLFEDKKYEMLEIFFTDEVGFTNGEELKRIIDKVLLGKSDYEYFGGNCCYINIRRDTSDLISAFSDSKEDETFCSLDTKELLEILNEWNKQQKVIEEQWLKAKLKIGNKILKFFK